MATTEERPAAATEEERKRNYCALPPQPVRELSPELAADRASAILVGSTKWVNGTVLHYYFFDKDTDGEQVRFTDGSTQFASWVGGEDQRQVVRQSFQVWKDLGIGLEFQEVHDRQEAEVRIGFMDGDGSWSYVGRGILGQSSSKRTMNYGWDLTTPYGHTTALHEIGHTVGLPHEHQNPFAGIVWDEQKVYATLGGPPNNWTHDATFNNILKKLSASEVNGSAWDPDSIMEYDFEPGLIKQPEKYSAQGVHPPGTISPVDKQWVRQWYPGKDPGAAAPPALEPFKSVPLMLKAHQQADFTFAPAATRQYQIATFGNSDTVMVLFEDVNGQMRYVSGDDDSGTDANANIKAKLFKGRRYVVRLRLYWEGGSGQTAVMCW